MRLSPVLLPVLFLSFSACTGTEVGNPDFDIVDAGAFDADVLFPMGAMKRVDMLNDCLDLFDAATMEKLSFCEQIDDVGGTLTVHARNACGQQILIRGGAVLGQEQEQLGFFTDRIEIDAVDTRVFEISLEDSKWSDENKISFAFRYEVREGRDFRQVTLERRR